MQLLVVLKFYEVGQLGKAMSQKTPQGDDDGKKENFMKSRG